VNAKKLEKVGSGSGGLVELVTKFDRGQIQFAGLKVVAHDVVNEGGISSKRVRMIRIDYVGPDVSPMKRAGVLNVKQAVNDAYQGPAATIQTTNADELTHKFLAQSLAKGEKATFLEFGSADAGDAQRFDMKDLDAQ